MAAKQRTIELVLSGKLSSGFSTAFARAQKGVNKYQRLITGVARSERSAAAARTSSTGSLLRSVAGYAAAYLGAQQLATGIWSCVKGYNEELTAENRMFQLMKNVKGTTQAQIINMKRYAEALMDTSTLTHETTERGMGQLATFGLQIRTIRKLTPALQDLAVGTFGLNATEQDLQKTGNLLGKVYSGQVGALRKVGISFSKAQEQVLKTGNESQKTAMLIKVINQNYGGLAKRMTATPEGRIQQLANAWGEVKEQVGGALSPMVMQALGQVGANLPQIRDVLVRIVAAGKQLITTLTPAAKSVYNIGKWVVTNWRLIAPIVAGIAAAVTAWKVAVAYLTVAQMALNLAMDLNPIGMVVVAIGVLIGLIALMILHWDRVKAALVIAYNWFIKFATEGPGRFIPIIGMISLIAKNWGTVKTALIGVWTWVKKVYDWFVKAFTAAKTLVTKAAASPVGRVAMRAIGGPVGTLIASKLQKRAAGGPVSAGRPYMVGERGPELFVPKRSGEILPNKRGTAGRSPNNSLSANAGGINLTINSLTINGAANANDVREGMRMALSDFKRLLAQAQRDDDRRSFA